MSSSDQSTLAERLAKKLPHVHSVENLHQILKTVVDEIPPEDLEHVYSEANDLVVLSLKRDGKLQYLNAVTPLLNLLTVHTITDKLSFSLIVSLDYNIYQAKIKWANQHKLAF